MNFENMSKEELIEYINKYDPGSNLLLLGRYNNDIFKIQNEKLFKVYNNKITSLK